MEEEIVKALTISQLERASGVPRTTIHYYIREGLLPRPQKTADTRALYSQHFVALLQAIAEHRQAGRSLAEIRGLLEPELAELGKSEIDLEAHEYERLHRTILELATKEFVHKGYRKTRLADLIRRLGISSSVFYEHFPTKRQLLVECFCTYIEWSIAFVEPTVDRSSDMVDRLLARSATGFSLYSLNADVLALVDSDALLEQPDLLKRVQEAWHLVDERVARELAAMRGPGAGRPAIPDEILAHLLGMAFHGGMMRAESDGSFSRSDFLRTMVWLWLAVRAAMTGRVDVDAELAACEERIQAVASAPPPVFPALTE